MSSFSSIRSGCPSHLSCWSFSCHSEMWKNMVHPYNFFRGGTEFLANFLMYSWYRWNWLTKRIAQKIQWEVSLLCDLSILAPMFAFSSVFYLFPPPNTLLSSYYYQFFFLMMLLCMYWASAVKICENVSGTFLFIGFLQFFYPFSAFLVHFLPFLPWCTLLNSYYTHLLITRIM